MAFAADAIAKASQLAPSGTAASELFYELATKIWWFIRQDGTEAPLGAAQPPAFAYVSNPGTVVNSTAAGNVVDTRPIVATSLSANEILEVTFSAFLSGTNNTKSLLIGIDADLSNALTATYAAGQTGIVTQTFRLLVANSGNVHESISRSDYNAGYALGGVKRGTVSVNFATTGCNLVTQAWVANAADSITIDSISSRLIGGGL